MREADWRFLLPRADAGVFEHLLLLGGSSGLGAYVADLGIARRVSRSPREGTPADLVVVLADADIAVDTLAPHIADRAVVYIEVDRHMPGRRMLTPRRVTRTLAAQGFTTAATYWVKPGFPRRDMYLPLGNRAALRWYLDTEYRATSRARRALKAAIYRLAHGDEAFAAVAPCFAVTAMRGMAVRPPAMVEQACAASADSIEPVFLATGNADWNRLVYVLFDHGAERPHAVLKLPRSVAYNNAVEHEHAILREVSAMLPPARLSSIPSSTLVRVGDLAVSAETCVRGTSVATRSGPGAASVDDLRCTVAWLTNFHRETTRGHADAVDWVAQELCGRLAREYKRLFGLTPAEARLCEAAFQSVDVHAGEVPIVWQHMDLGPWNVYRDGAHVSVIDWESARRGPALADLLYFVLHWSAAVRGCETGEQRIRHFESLFCGPVAPDAIGRAIDAQLGEYMDALAVAPALLPHVLLYTVLEHAIGRARLLERTGRAPSRDIGVNEYVGYVGVIARHHDLLFHETHSHGAIYATG